jgi:hypothetical protein
MVRRAAQGRAAGGVKANPALDKLGASRRFDVEAKIRDYSFARSTAAMAMSASRRFETSSKRLKCADTVEKAVKYSH